MGLWLYLLWSGAARLDAQCIRLEALAVTYTENFDSLASAGESSATPAGWYFAETGANANSTYTASNGAANSGDTYSFGSGRDRAFGGLRSGSLVPTIGACFVNATGRTLTSLAIKYNGEQWRLGALNRPDRLQFEFSTSAAGLLSGSYTRVTALDFNAPVMGPEIGAIAGGASTAIRSEIRGLAIEPGSTFWLRWTDFDASGADDGLAVDDFALMPLGPTGLTIDDVSVPEGDFGTTTVEVIVKLADAAPAGGVTFDIATADGTATAGSDYVARSLTGQTIAAGQTSYRFSVTILGDTVAEPDEYFTVTVSNIKGTTATRATATVTIVNDDPLPIGVIQGAGSVSPFVGQNIVTSGVVTARKSNGFFLQTPEGSEDADPETSEGIFIFTSSAPPAEARAGNLVKVSGRVAEFRPASDAYSPTLTEITAPAVTLLATGVRLPRAVLLTGDVLSPFGPIDQLERFEGMRVHVESLTVTGPSGGSVNEALAAASSDGAFYGVITGTPRPFREPGIEVPDPLPTGSPCCVAFFDSNPERLRVDSNGQAGSAILNVTTGSVVTNLTGPLDYALRTYSILPDPGSAHLAAENSAAVAVPAPTGAQFTIAAFNMERFFDTVDDAGISDVALTPAAFAGRLNKASLTIRNVLRYPDILAVEEMENLPTLQQLAARIDADAAAAGEPLPGYTALLEEGNDPGGIDVGFLVKSTRVDILGVSQEGAHATYIDPGTNRPALLNDRPPLVLRAAVRRPAGEPFRVTVIVNHLRSLLSISDPIEGPRVRAKRAAQAEFLANLIQSRQTADGTEAIAVVGDFNAFPFSDGYADVMGTIRGEPAAAETVVTASPDLVNPDLVDAELWAEPGERYSYVFGGNAQTIDHVLVSQTLVPYLAGFAYGRSNADFPESMRGDFQRPERLSDHDAPVAYFNLFQEGVAIHDRLAGR